MSPTRPPPCRRPPGPLSPPPSGSRRSHRASAPPGSPHTERGPGATRPRLAARPWRKLPLGSWRPLSRRGASCGSCTLWRGMDARCPDSLRASGRRPGHTCRPGVRLRDVRRLSSLSRCASLSAFVETLSRQFKHLSLGLDEAGTFELLILSEYLDDLVLVLLEFCYQRGRQSPSRRVVQPVLFTATAQGHTVLCYL